MSTGNRTKRFDDMVKGHIANALEQLRVAQPGLIESYDDATGLAEVVPLLKRPIFGPGGTVTWRPLEKLVNVPVVHLAGGRQRIKLPVEVARSDTANVGDVVLLIFCDFDIGGWKSKEGAKTTQGVVQPATLGAHQVADAIAIAGLYNPLDPTLSVAIEVKTDGTVVLDQGAHQLLRGDTYRSAQTTLDNGFKTFLTALSTYATAIKTIADPTNAATPPILAAITALTAAINAFEGGSYLSRNLTS